MKKTFTCCELVKRIINHQESFNWADEEKKFYFSEHVFKAIGNKDLCEECRGWFTEQMRLQSELIRNEVEKEKAEGKYYGPRNPKTYEGTIMEDSIKRMRGENTLPPFGKSPQE